MYDTQVCTFSLQLSYSKQSNEQQLKASLSTATAELKTQLFITGTIFQNFERVVNCPAFLLFVFQYCMYYIIKILLI